MFTSPTLGGPVTTSKVFIGPLPAFLRAQRRFPPCFFLRYVADFAGAI
ncbi:MAG TPA: hypothetical protein VGO37_15215 [Steroidobacteraceae bacterium]|nr:hypothetical protein [Steroidobacteraceae bacterium]